MASETKVNKIKQLQNKVHELETLLNSIKYGEVDALVGVDSQGAQSIFTIEGADQPYRLLIESFSSGVLTLNEDGKIIHCNRQFSKMINVPLQSVIGSLMSFYIPQGQHESLQNFISQSKLKDTQYEFTLEGDKTLLFSSHNIKFGSVNGITIIVTDISDIKREHNERLKLKDELIQRDQLFRDFAENIDDVFWCMNTEMDHVIYVSPAYEKIWGQPVDSLYINALSWINSIIKEDKDHVKLFRQKLLTEDYATTEYRIVLKDGIRFISARGFQNKDKQGKVINVIGIASDITELKKIEAQVHLNDKLRIMGILAASVAHEINNPMAWILGNLEYIKRKADSLNPFQLKELMNESIEGSKRISNIVLSLKEFTKLNDQNVTLIDLNQIIESTLKVAFSEIKLRAVLETKYTPNLPLVLANSGKLHQVFLNLIINAAQAIPEGKAKKNKIYVSTEQQDKYIKVDIRDTGNGIDPDKISKIFDPFFTTKSKGLGTGLGLSITQEIIKSLGGEITVKSLPGKGATFSVYLPVASQTMKTPKEVVNKNAKVIATARKRILLTDDEPLLLKSIQRMLQDDYDVSTASSGQAAISLLQDTKHMFDVLIFDYNMPGMSGFELYQFVAIHFPGVEKRIIFITGNLTIHDENEILNNLKNTYLTKPFEQKELINAIEKIGPLGQVV